MCAAQDILLTTLNAKYAHSAFGLRCLLANMGELRERTILREWEASARTIDLLEAILNLEPRIVGFGVYIWNVAPLTALVADLKALRPGIIVVLGGPEVSHEADGQPIVALADHVIQGEGDLAFAALCRALLREPGELGEGEPVERPPKIIAAPLPDLTRLASPYGEYTDEDVAQRVIYAEASRGCPFLCEFCLSSLDRLVRAAPIEAFLAELDQLYSRGARQIKLVDRTFNLHIEASRQILTFLLERAQGGLFSHLEVVPDRLPEPLRELLRRFPPGTLQVEVGIQTLDPVVSARISRRLDRAKIAENLRFLREETNVHVHADLIIGLPGEGLDSFGAGFDTLYAMRPQEIQVGLLKRLRGTPIIRHDREFGMVYSQSPPYEILETAALPAPTLSRLKRFARYWELVANSGNFVGTLPLLLGDRPFQNFLDWSDWLWARTGQTHQLSLPRLGQLLHAHLIDRGDTAGANTTAGASVAAALWDDWLRPGRHDVPGWLRELLPDRPLPSRREALGAGPRRQARHQAGGGVSPPASP